MDTLEDPRHVPIPVRDRVVVPNAQHYETHNRDTQASDPFSFRHRHVPPQERLDRNPLFPMYTHESGPRTIEMGTFQFEQVQLLIWGALRSTLKFVGSVRAF